MWKNLSVSRWIFLLSFAVVMLVSASEASNFLQLSCCYEVDNKIRGRIQECFKLRKKGGCAEAFVIRLSRTKWQCISPTHKRINERIKKGDLKCPSAFKRRFED
ncbi:C-C motif chemokine 28-like [Stegastes partitus]|uniref:C-C motif chemokine 28-like n=1 Tax=Stegastes partitus TaxID=144197 RepID=A0A9Y4NKI0_9TELE|nr:PREDICTED: C-C motif chemokine 28-like [Stegastes partitus]